LSNTTKLKLLGSLLQEILFESVTVYLEYYCVIIKAGPFLRSNISTVVWLQLLAVAVR